MKIESGVLAVKLKKIKGALDSRANEVTGVIVKNNYLYAGNYKIGIRAKIEAEETGDEFVIPKQAIEFIGSLPNGIVEITKKENAILIKCGNIKNKYQTISIDDALPEMQAVSFGDNTMSINGGKLKSALNSVLYAVADDGGREALKGVLFDARNGYLNIVGCDGYRLAWNRVVYNREFKVIVPKAAVRQILSIGIDGDISFAWDNNTISFKSDEYEVISRVLSGEYIDYEKMFVSQKYNTELEHSSISECIRRAMICAGNEKIICCEFNNDTVCVTAKQNLSDYEESVELKTPISETVTIGFNSRYLADALSSFKSDNVQIKFSSPTQALTIENERLKALLLPVRLR